jgi:hypothetical protein
MAQDKVQGNQVPKWTSRDNVPGQRLDSATYIGIVKNNVDPTRSGRLQVWIPEFGNSQTDSESNSVFWRTVSYASPYFGSTFHPEKSTNNTFVGTNQTYGMWMVPPDIGNQVLCTFVNGDPNRGYWFACISPTLSHYMVPGIAAGNKIESNVSAAISKSVLKSSTPPQSLPVSEFNENQPDSVKGSFYENPKPIHDFQANVLFKQGLDRDKTRGAISSSSQRETPSQVFGISTPGRPFGNDTADDPNYQEKLATGKINPAEYAIKTRKGGHQFVMDDGDVMGKDQLVRIRSASGHQILMHDTEKVMYIANSEGSVWIELAESGHMHIYTAGGFNLRTEGELNLHGKSIKMQSEGDVNISAVGAFNVSGSAVRLTGTSDMLLYGGKINMGSGSSMTLSSGKIVVSSSGAITIDGSTIDLNNGGGGNSIGPANLQAFKHDDTTYDTNTGLWSTVVDSATSIVGVMPAHEPWKRNASTLGPAPEKQVQNSICAPMGGTAGGTYAGGTNSKGLGMVSEKYETGGRGSATVGWDQVGGTSYGKYQIASKVGAMTDYLNYLTRVNPEAANKLRAAGPPDSGKNGKFAETWISMANAGEFGDTEHNFIKTKYDFAMGKVSNTSVRTLIDSDRGLQEMMWSTSVHHGPSGAASIINTVYRQGMSKEDFVKSVYAERRTKFGGSSANVQAGVQNRFNNEEPEIRSLLGQPGLGSDGAAEAPGTPSTPLTNGAGNTVATTDGLTNTNATDKKDIGITNAAGKSIDNKCPAEYLGKEGVYKPPSGIGSGKPTLNQNHALAMHAELGFFESKWAYDMSENNRLGKYQVDAAYLADSSRGYIKSDAVSQYGVNAMLNDASWTGKDKINSYSSFVEFKSIQDDIQFKEFNDNYAALKSNGGIKETDDLCTAAGMLFVAHQFRSVDKAKEWRDKGELKDELGVAGEVYFNHGRYAIDVLSAGYASSTSPSSTAGGENVSGINPDDVFTFTSSGSGTRASFDSLNGQFKTQICKMGQLYKEKTGSKIGITSAVRSQAEQTVLYDAWVAAGGRIPDRPVVDTPRGRIFTPAKNVGSHGGVAIDSGQMELVVSTLGASVIAELGLKWGGTFSTPDKVHIQLAGS